MSYLYCNVYEKTGGGKLLFLEGGISDFLARSCNVATDRLVYHDVRGLSATEP